MQEINVYVKGVVYQNKGKGFALSAWAVKGEPVHYIEHEVNSAYNSEYVALCDAVEKKHADDVVLHIYSNQKDLIDNLSRIKRQYDAQEKKLNLPDYQRRIITGCDFTWCPLKESPNDLLRLRDMAMREVKKRGKARV